MAERKYGNNISTKLTSQLLAAGTTANVTFGTGTLFAAATGGDWIIGTLRRMSGFKDVAREIVKITAVSTDALTITRAQEGTTALQFEIGDQLDVDFTAATITDLPTPTSVAGVAVVSGGIPGIVALNTQSGKTAAFTAQTVYTVPADGFYEIGVYGSVTTAAASGTISLIIGWTDADANVAATATPSAMNVTPVGSNPVGSVRFVKAKAGTTITITTTFSTVVGTPTYNVYTLVKKV